MSEIAAVPGVIITDCYDDQTRMRQTLLYEGLFGYKPDFVPIHDTHHADLEATSALLGAVDTWDMPGMSERPRLAIVNAAPRGKDLFKEEADQDRYHNGVPFCYYWAGQTLVLSTYTPSQIGMLRRLGVIKDDTVNLMHIPDVVPVMVNEGLLTNKQAEEVIKTQFRSRNFVPYAAKLLLEGVKVPSEKVVVTQDDTAANRVCHIDNFGNVKTTILPKEIDFQPGIPVSLHKRKKVMCYDRLSEVEEGESALIIGSSGYRDCRLLEVVVQRGKAKKAYNFHIGDTVLQLD